MPSLHPLLTRRRVVALIGAAGFACPRPARAAETNVTIDNFVFTPKELTVARGGTVVWTNHDDIPHSIVAVDGAFRSHALDTGDAFRFTFDAAGRFAYFCGLHPHMTGTIMVTG